LLRRLTAVVPDWYVWKNADSALAGQGDVDSLAPRAAWPLIVAEFRAWARASELGPVVVCRHTPGALIVVGSLPSTPTRLLQLDVYDRAARVVPAERLVGASELDTRGFRRLRPGAEGLLLLLVHARRAGRPPRRLEDLWTVRRLLSDDPGGAELASEMLGPVGAPAVAGAKAVLADSWSRRAMLGLEPVYAVGAVRDLRRRATWLRFKLTRGHRCPVLTALASGRVVSEDLGAWLDRVERGGHAVYGRGDVADE